MTVRQADLKFLKPIKWLTVALGLKILFCFSFIYFDTNPGRNNIGCFSKLRDHDEYIRPIDNLIEKGSYSLDGKGEPYAGRLPGFVFPYIIFRALLNEYASNILLGCFILVLSAFASYVFSLLIYHLTQKRRAFITAFFLLNCIPFYWHFDWALHANSLAASCFIFFLYYFYHYSQEKKLKHLLFAGFFIGWVALLRGYCLVFLPFATVFLVYSLFAERKSIREITIAVCLFILPFFLFESAWITRNYVSLHKFIPFQTSFVPGSDSKNPEYNTNVVTKHSMMSVRKLIFAWGGDNTWYFMNSHMAWFIDNKKKLTTDFRFDENIFFEGFTLDSLELLKSSIAYSFKDSLSQTRQDSIENRIVATADRYHSRFVTNKKMYYFLWAPFMRFKNFLLKNPTQDWPGPSFDKCNIFQKSFRLLSFLQYAVILASIFIFPFVYLIKRNKTAENRFYVFLFLLLLVHIVPFITVIYMSHYSYFIFGYLMLIPLFIFSIDTLLSKKQNG